MKKLLIAAEVERALNTLCQGIITQLTQEAPDRIAVIGIRTRGELLARRLVERIREEKPKLEIDYGILDITFYRDDLSLRRGAPVVKATEIEFDLDDAWVLLVDDVLQTGRSIRAALDAIHDFGRPRAVRLAVLVDRGGRELPISADFVGKKVKAPHGQRVQVKLKEHDGEEGVFIVEKTTTK